MEEDLIGGADASARKKSDFSQGKVSRAIMRIALPMTAAQLINILYSIADKVYMGHLPDVGRVALTGVGVTVPVVSIIMSVASLCGTGGAPLFSISRGKGDDKEAERIMGNSFTLLMLFGIVITVLVIAFRRPILYLFGASDATYPYASEYLVIYTLGTIFIMVGLGMNPFINSQGFGKVGMLTIALGAIVNSALDPIFIFAMNMGVRGAALSTLIGQAVSAIWVMRFLTGKNALLRLRLSCMKLQAARVKKIITLGLSGFFMSLSNSLIQIVCNVTLKAYGGDLYVGIMAVINSVREVIFMPVSGINNGAVPVIGYNYGANEPERVRGAIRFSVTVTVAYSAVMWALMMLFPGILIRIFNSEPELIKAGIPAIRIYFMLFIFMSLQMASQVVFLGLGRSKNAIFFSLLRKAIIATPLTLLLPWLGMGTTGVFVAESISQLVGGLACFLTMYFAVYRKLANSGPARLTNSPHGDTIP